MKPASPRQEPVRNPAPRHTRAREYTDQELSDLMDDEQEQAHEILHGPCAFPASRWATCLGVSWR